jgi:hypothetical protein
LYFVLRKLSVSLCVFVRRFSASNQNLGVVLQAWGQVSGGLAKDWYNVFKTWLICWWCSSRFKLFGGSCLISCSSSSVYVSFIILLGRKTTLQNSCSVHFQYISNEFVSKILFVNLNESVIDSELMKLLTIIIQISQTKTFIIRCSLYTSMSGW